MNDYLRVGMTSKSVSEQFEFAAQISKVINLPVKNNGAGSSFVPDRLSAAWQVDDAETAHPERRATGEQQPLIVRTAMFDRGHHPSDDGLALFRRFDSDDAADAAHWLDYLESHNS